jgi:hypothetical protein
VEEHDTLAVLRLRDLTVKDLGNYSCHAKNSQGEAKDHIELSGGERQILISCPTASLSALAGKPEVATINSSPEGLYRSNYNLTWTVRSKAPLTEVRLLVRRLVSRVEIDSENEIASCMCVCRVMRTPYGKQIIVQIESMSFRRGSGRRRI